MFARLARYDIGPDRLEDAVSSFAEVGGGLAGLDGFERGYILVDEDEGLLLTLTLWRSRLALEASETRASLLRQRAVKAAGGTVQSVHCYEVRSELGDGSQLH
jgi:heme-degrading monooxygenase HmoA